MRRVRAVPEDLALLPLVDRLLGDAKALGQDAGRLMAGRDLGTHGSHGAGVLVQGYQHGFAPRYQLLQNRASHEEWVAFWIYAIIRDATSRHMLRPE